MPRYLFQYRREQRVDFEVELDVEDRLAAGERAVAMANQLKLGSEDDQSDDPGEIELVEAPCDPRPRSQHDTEAEAEAEAEAEEAAAMGIPRDALEQILEMARRHGEDGPFEDGALLEAGDLRQLLTTAWGFLGERGRKHIWVGFKGEWDALGIPLSRYDGYPKVSDG